MSKTIKQICDIASIRSSLGKQAAYFNSPDETLAYLANEAVHELLQHPWSKLRTEGTVSMTTETLYSLPSDLNYVVADTMNADGQERYIKFPAADNIFWYHKTHQPSGIRYQVRIRNEQLEVLNPDNGVDLKFEYISTNCVLSEGSLAGSIITPNQQEFVRDGDVWALDDELLIKDLKWRFKKEKGIEGWETDKMLFNDYLKKLKGQEAGSRVIDFTNRENFINPEPYTDLYV